MWTQATQGFVLVYGQGRRLKIIVIGGCFTVVNLGFTEIKSATHTQSERFLWG